MYFGLHVKYPSFLFEFNENLNFSTFVFSKNIQIPNFMRIRPVGAELFHVDRRAEGGTGMTKLIVTFRNFANAPQN